MAQVLSILIPTKNRCHLVGALLDSIKALRSLERIQPEVIIGDNDSEDQTWKTLQAKSKDFPTPLRLLKVTKPGKCAVLNEAIRAAKGKILTFLDDDVTLEHRWLEGVCQFFQTAHFRAAQGIIRIPSPESEDPEIRVLLERYRTIPHLEYNGDLKEVHSLNGANMAIRREVFDQVGNFDERLGPGASGTSEDVELAQRIRQAGMQIGYMRQAVVFHQVDRSRLTEAYFKSIHESQGRSRMLFKNLSIGQILLDLSRAYAQYGFHSITGTERDKYRSKGRIYHYLGMLKTKLNPRSDRESAVPSFSSFS